MKTVENFKSLMRMYFRGFMNTKRTMPEVFDWTLTLEMFRAKTMGVIDATVYCQDITPEEFEELLDYRETLMQMYEDARRRAS